MTTLSNPSTLIIQVHSFTGCITLNRPDVRNAFNDSVIAEITAAFTG